jgi:hypothetical protein
MRIFYQLWLDYLKVWLAKVERSREENTNVWALSSVVG